MSAQLIQQAIDMGYTSKQVLDFLKHQIPSLKKGIKSAKESGYPDQMILQFLSNKIPSKNPKAAKEQLTHQQQYLKNVGIKTKGEREEERNQFLKTAAQVGLASIPAYRLGQSLGLIARSASKAIYPSEILPALTKQKQLTSPATRLGLPATRLGLPAPGPKAPTQPKLPMSPNPQLQSNQLTNPNLGLLPQHPQQNPDVGPQPQQPQQAPPAGQATAQTPGPLTPDVPRQPNPKHPDLIKQMGLENIVKGLANKEDPKTISQVVEQHFLKPEQKKWLSSQTDEPLENVISDYIAEHKSFSNDQPLEGNDSETQEAVTQELPKKEESKEISAGDNVSVPSGKKGKVKDISKKIATVAFENGRDGRYLIKDIKKLTESKPEAKKFEMALYHKPGETKEEWEQRKFLADASKKAAQEIVKGKSFLDFPIPKEALGVTGLSVAEDVLNFMAGNANAYEYLDKDDREEVEQARDLYGAQITPNMVWNMLLVHEPKLSQTEMRPKSVKGKEMIKGGKMGSTEFRRSLTHMVYGMISGKGISTALSDKIQKLSNARVILDTFDQSFKQGKQHKISEEMSKLMDDDYFNGLFTEEIEEMVKKLR
jgi:hypothetical protein